MIKLIASDMDDTFVPAGTLKPPAMFKELIEKLNDKKINFAVASGRPYTGLKKMFEDYNAYDIIYIAENGAMIVKDEEVLYRSFMDSFDVRQSIDLLKEHEYTAIILTYDFGAYLLNCKEHMKDKIKSYLPFHTEIEDYAMQEGIMKISVYYEDKIDENTFEFLKSELGNKLKVIKSGTNWLDIHNMNTTKGSAIKFLQEKFDISYEETMVFGDFYNDIEMLDSAYYSYAMINAPKDVKEHANFITTETSLENAVIETIKQVLNLQ